MSDIILNALKTEARQAKYTLKSKIQDTTKHWSKADPAALAEELQRVIDKRLGYYYEVEEKIEDRKRELGLSDENVDG